MLRWVPLILVSACDQAPRPSHSIRYDIGRDLTKAVDLDRGSLVAARGGKASHHGIDAAR
jgi:hypothetical protein